MTEANDRIIPHRSEARMDSVTKFPGVNAMGERPIEETKGGGLDGREGSLGGVKPTGVMATGKFGSNGGEGMQVMTPSIKKRSGSRKMSGGRR